MTRKELDQLMTEGVDDSSLKRVPRIFLIPRKSADYSTVSDETLKRALGIIPSSGK